MLRLLGLTLLLAAACSLLQPVFARADDAPEDYSLQYWPPRSSLPELLGMLKSEQPAVQFTTLSGLMFWDKRLQEVTQTPDQYSNLAPASAEEQALCAEIFEAVAGLLHSDEPYVRNAAGRAFQFLGPASKPYVLKALDDPDPAVRLAATQGVGYQADAELIEVAAAHLTESDEKLREAFINIVAHGSDKARVRELLLPLVNAGNTDYALRNWLSSGGEEFLPELISMLSSPDDKLKGLALPALNDMGDKAEPAFDAMLSALEADDRWYGSLWQGVFRLANAEPKHIYPLFYALRRCRSQQALAAVASAAGDTEPSERMLRVARVWYASGDLRMHLLGGALLKNWELGTPEIEAEYYDGANYQAWNAELADRLPRIRGDLGPADYHPDPGTLDTESPWALLEHAPAEESEPEPAEAEK